MKIFNGVLILIMLDVLLGGSNIFFHILNQCLNPYYVGCTSRRKPQVRIPLNCTVLILIMLDVLLGDFG